MSHSWLTGSSFNNVPLHRIIRILLAYRIALLVTTCAVGGGTIRGSWCRNARSGVSCAALCGTCLGFRHASSVTGSSDTMLHVCHVKLITSVLWYELPGIWDPRRDSLHYWYFLDPVLRAMQIQGP